MSQWVSLHHEQNGWYDEARVGGVAEQRPHEGRQVQVDGLHDHVKHLRFPTGDGMTQQVCVCVCVLKVDDIFKGDYFRVGGICSLSFSFLLMRSFRVILDGVASCEVT